MCYPRGEFRLGESDVYLGDVDATPFYMSESQFNYWQHTHLTVDVVPGRGSGFSVRGPRGRALPDPVAPALAGRDRSPGPGRGGNHGVAPILATTRFDV